MSLQRNIMALVSGREQSDANSSSYSYLSTADVEWEEFYKTHRDVVPSLLGSVPSMRKIMAHFKERARILSPLVMEGVAVETIYIRSTNDSTIELRAYTPTFNAGPFPSLIYMHGGGWTLGDLEADDGLCRAVCVEVNIKIFSVGYRLAPEHPFPAAIEDCWASLKWVVEYAEPQNIFRERIILGGSSAGANLAAALTYKARTHGIEILAQILRMPALCHPDCFPEEFEMLSMNQNKHAPILSRESMVQFFAHYNAPDPADPDVSPLLGENFSILPPTYIQVCGGDPLRDEGLAYASKLIQSSVPCTIDVYPGLPHAFTFFPELSVSQKFGADMMRNLKRLVEQSL